MSGLYPSRDGLSKKQIDEVLRKARDAVLPLRNLGLDPHQFRELAELADRIAIEMATGRLTPEKLKAWDAQVWADARAHQSSDRDTAQLLKDVNQRLWDECNEGYFGLQHANIGHHPRFARAMIDWHHRRKGEETRGKTYVSRARHAGTAMLSDNPNATGNAMKDSALSSSRRIPSVIVE